MLTIEDLNKYSSNKENIISNIELLEEEDIKQLNNKEEYESLILHCKWIIKDAETILQIIEKENKK